MYNDLCTNRITYNTPNQIPIAWSGLKYVFAHPRFIVFSVNQARFKRSLSKLQTIASNCLIILYSTAVTIFGRLYGVLEFIPVIFLLSSSQIQSSPLHSTASNSRHHTFSLAFQSPKAEILHRCRYCSNPTHLR